MILKRRNQNEQFKQNYKPSNRDKRNEQNTEKTFSSVEKAEMKKLTRMTDKGAALVMADGYEDQAAAKADLKARFREALNKLYQYESLGLEPEELYSILQLTATIRTKLNRVVTWKSPRKDKAYISKLNAVKIFRDIKTEQVKVSAELIDDKGNIVYGDIGHIEELKDIKFE
jgi:hypothetical protein